MRFHNTFKKVFHSTKHYSYHKYTIQLFFCHNHNTLFACKSCKYDSVTQNSWFCSAMVSLDNQLITLNYAQHIRSRVFIYKIGHFETWLWVATVISVNLNYMSVFSDGISWRNYHGIHVHLTYKTATLPKNEAPCR